MNLTPSQLRVVDEFSLFLVDPNKKEMVIAGAAGTGKSFLIKHLAERIEIINQLNSTLGISRIIPYFTATTNKAVDVLSKFIGYKYGYSFSTIHSLLGLSVVDDIKSKNTKLVKKHLSNNTIHSDALRGVNSLIFIDEAGMIDINLYKIINEHLKDTNAKIVYIGDNYQLPPVNENSSVIFNNKNTFFLTDIVRQTQDSPIIELASKFRELLDKGSPFKWPEITPDNKSIFKIESKKEFGKLALEAFSEEDINKNKILAYTNSRVISYNEGVRKLFTLKEDFQPGEWVYVNSPVTLKGNIYLFSSDTPVRIKRIECGISHDHLEGFLILFYATGSIPFFFPKRYEDVRLLMKDFAKAKIWSEYHRVKNNYIDIRLPYAQTCHKSQGSTYENVFIDLEDISKNRSWSETCRLVYVAITRASDKVYFYGNLENRWEG